MAVSGEECCKKVRGVRLEWNLGYGLNGAKDAMRTRASLWLRLECDHWLIICLSGRALSEQELLRGQDTTEGSNYWATITSIFPKKQQCKHIGTSPARSHSDGYYSWDNCPHAQSDSYWY